jgi:hypothetical protein
VVGWLENDATVCFHDKIGWESEIDDQQWCFPQWIEK